MSNPLIAFIVGMAVGCAATCLGVWLESREYKKLRALWPK